MTVAEAPAGSRRTPTCPGPAALSEARRATFDPTYGRYTWGKLEIMDLRERARQASGARASRCSRFHTALLGLGSPPLGLLGTAMRPRLTRARATSPHPATALAQASRTPRPSRPVRPSRPAGQSPGTALG